MCSCAVRFALAFYPSNAVFISIISRTGTDPSYSIDILLSKFKHARVTHTHTLSLLNRASVRSLKPFCAAVSSLLLALRGQLASRSKHSINPNAGQLPRRDCRLSCSYGTACRFRWTHQTRSCQEGAGADNDRN